MNNELKTMLAAIMKEALQPIQEELQIIKSQLDENTQITKAIRDRQEETDAKLDSLSLDVYKIQGDMISVKEKVGAIQNEIEFTYQKTTKNEMEIFKLRRDHTES